VYEITIEDALEGTERVKEPSTAVVVPIVVPFTITEAFARPKPFSSVTLPLMVRLWPITCVQSSIMPIISKNNFLISFIILITKTTI
jgi:hypothetical protein